MKRFLSDLLGALLLATLVALPTRASAQMSSFDFSVEVSGCTVTVSVSGGTSREYVVNVQVYDSDLDELYSASYDGFLPVTLSIPFTQSYSGTIYVYYEVADFAWGQVEREINCVVAAAPSQSEGVPCGPTLIGIGQGLLVRPTPLYWAPRQNAASTIILQTTPDAKTYWVLGIDSTRSFYKIVIACKTYWVPADTLVPNPDGVWRGAPLPTRIVD